MKARLLTVWEDSCKSACPSLGWKWVMVAILTSITVLGSAKENQPEKPIPPQAKPYGLSLGDLGIAYWEWMFSLPNTDHPAYEQGEVVSGYLNQPKRFFILESGNPGVWDREIQIPAGKGILFTLGDGCFENLVLFPGASVQDLLDFIHSYYAATDTFNVGELDGRPIPMDDHFAISDPFTLTIGDDGLFGYPAGTADAIVAGWIVMLPPLSAGEHTMHLHSEAPSEGYLSDTAFHITVK